MKSLDRDQFTSLLKQQHVKQRLKRELRFAPEDIVDWDIFDLLAIGTRSGIEGILLLQTNEFYIIPYSLNIGLTDSKTGRAKPITCDFCYTWQQGRKAGRITFRRTRDDHTFTYLCCADLNCSLNVRNLTAESTLSRTQLHEDITTDQRIERMLHKLSMVIETLDIQPASPLA